MTAPLAVVLDRDVVTRQHRCASDESNCAATRTRGVDHSGGRNVNASSSVGLHTSCARAPAPCSAVGTRCCPLQRSCTDGWLALSGNVSFRGLDACSSGHTDRGHMIEFATGFVRTQSRKLLALLWSSLRPDLPTHGTPKGRGNRLTRDRHFLLDEGLLALRASQGGVPTVRTWLALLSHVRPQGNGRATHAASRSRRVHSLLP
jgi:hypothetical protein